MKLIRLHATFGQLKNRELTLHDGLNIITCPNEGGKSTWSAFLLSMFYGVDTTERLSRTAVPIKTQYRPWDGSSMEGRIDLEFQGQAITIERTTLSDRAPMGKFRAYETASGQPLDWLSDQTCGLLLLGAERSVFERSALVRQGNLALSRDSGLEQQLHALVTQGDEGPACLDLTRALKDLKNRCQHNRTGLLPQARQELEEVQRQLAAIVSVCDRLEQLRRSIAEAEISRQTVRQQLDALDAALTRDRQEKAYQASREAQSLQLQALQLHKRAALLPEVSQLQSALDRLDAAQKSLQTLALDEALGQPEPQKPEAPPALRHLEPTRIRQTAQEDKKEASSLTQPLPGVNPFGLLLAVFFGLTGIAGLAGFLPHTALGSLSLIACLICFGFWLVRIRRRKELTASRMDRMAEILKSYHAADPEAIDIVAQSYLQALVRYRQESDAYASQQQTLSARRRESVQELEELTRFVHSFSPQTQADACRTVLLDALQLKQQAQLTQREAQRAAAYAQAIRATLSDAAPLSTASPLPKCTREELTTQLSHLESTLVSLRAQAAQEEGRLLVLGDRAWLEARQEQLLERIDALQLRFDALTLALSAAESAASDLQSRFAPALSTISGEIMHRLTDGRYDTVLLDRELELSARQTGQVADHALRLLSRGTGDQLYFAVRLAISRLVLPNKTPLVFDDALVSFDDERAARALAILQEEAADRQILLFTCHGREQQLLPS